MPPAIRAFLALPESAKAIMDECLELVPGVPLTQRVRDTLATGSHYCTKPKVWKFWHTREVRASRKNGVKETHVTHELRISAYFANRILSPAVLALPNVDAYRWTVVWVWEGTELVQQLVAAKAIIKRIEAGELCGGCHLNLAMSGCRLCNGCAIHEFMNS